MLGMRVCIEDSMNILANLRTRNYSGKTWRENKKWTGRIEFLRWMMLIYFRNPDDEEDLEDYEEDTEDPSAGSRTGADAKDPRVPVSDTEVRDPPIGVRFLRFRRTRWTNRTPVDGPIIP